MKTFKTSPFAPAGAAFAALVLFAIPPALHAQSSFTGTGANWSDAANWSAGVPNAPAASALFDLSANPGLRGRAINLATSPVIGALTVNGANAVDAAAALNIGTGAAQILALNNSGSAAAITLSGGLKLNIAASITSAGALEITNNSGVLGAINLLGPVNAGANTITFHNDTTTADITVSGALTAGSIAKTGNGKLFLNSTTAAAIAGDVNFDAGTLVIGGNNVLGTGVIIVSAGPGEKTLNLAAGAAGYSLSNSIDLSGHNLAVGREDAATATTLRTLAIAPAAATTTGLGASRVITVGSLTGLEFGANQSFSGGALVKQGGGVLVLGGAASTFSQLQVNAGSVVGNITGAASLGGASSIFGAGPVVVDGGNTSLEIRGAGASSILTLEAGADISLSNEATFRLTGATLALLSGTINLNNSGILDYAGNVILGSTAILNASATSLNFAGNVA
ncbi:MAG: hypothetical protein LBM92_07460, partial [Opitutaceae bacterium]|nr:hypothetical protein [Opitutaceae bacterium]